MPRKVADSKRPYRQYVRRPQVPFTPKSQYIAPAVRQNITGQGGYSIFDRGGRVSKGVGSVLGRELGSTIGMGDLGAKAGNLLGGLFHTLTGVGEYTVHSNSLIGMKSGKQIVSAIPKFEGDSIRVRHKEFVQTVSSTTSFTNTTFAVNPGNQELFSWLSVIASNYEKFTINGLVIFYRSLSADALNSTNTALGKVIGAYDYNSADDAFTTIDQAYNAMHSNSGPPSKDMVFPMECSPKNKTVNSYYVRTGNVPSDEDVRLYDPAVFQLITDASQAAAQIGELWVSYDITLFSPCYRKGVGEDQESSKVRLTGPTNAEPFGTADNWTLGHNEIGLTLTGNRITFPATISSGTYAIMYVCNGDSTAIGTPTVSLSNCSAATVLTGNAAGFLASTGTVSQYFYYTILNITGQSAYINFAGDGTLPANATGGDLIVCKMNYEAGQQN